MAEEVTSLRLSIDSREVKTAQKELDKLSSSANGTEKSAKSLSLGFGALSSVIAGISIGALAKQFIDMADTMTGMKSKLKLVTNSTQELATAQNELFKIAQKTRQGFEETVSTYSNFALAMGEMGKSQKEILRVTETVNKAIAISGGTAQQAAAATMQLGQAFASGTLRGDELNSILENSKGLAQAIADGMGVPIGKLRSLGAEGKITAEILATALEKSATSVDEKFSKVGVTVGMTVTQIENSLLQLVGDADQSMNGSGGLADIFSYFSKSMDNNRAEIIESGKDALRALQVMGVGLIQFGAGFYGAMVAIPTAIALAIDASTQLVENGINNMIGLAEDAANKVKSIYGGDKVKLGRVDIDTNLSGKLLAHYNSIVDVQENAIATQATLFKDIMGNTTELAKIAPPSDKGAGKKGGGTELTKEQISAAKKAAKEAEKLRLKEIEIQKGYLESYAQLQADEAVEEYNIKVGYLESYRELEAQTAIETYNKQKEITKSIGDINAEASLTYNEQQLRQIEEEKKARIKAGYDVANAEAEAQAKIKRLQRQNSIELIAGIDVAKNAVMGLENALVDAFMTGKFSAQDMFRAIAADLARMAIRQAITTKLFSAISQAFTGTPAPIKSANGNAFIGGKTQAFADGGAFTNSVVSKPTTAPMALFGEAGPEAIMPLQRTSDGKLGVVATGTPTQNIKIEMINQSGQELQTTQSEQKFNGEQWVIGVVIDAARRNRSGMRDVLRGGQ